MTTVRGHDVEVSSEGQLKNGVVLRRHNHPPHSADVLFVSRPFQLESTLLTALPRCGS